MDMMVKIPSSSTRASDSPLLAMAALEKAPGTSLRMPVATSIV